MFRYYISVLILTLTTVSCDNNSEKETKYLSIQPGPENGKDAQIALYKPDENFSDEQYLLGFSWTILNKPNICRSLISFPLLGINNLSKIDSAFMSLTVIPGVGTNAKLSIPSGNNELVFRRVVENWNRDSVTWFQSPKTAEINEVYSQKLDSSSVGNKIIIDVTKMLQDGIVENTKEFGISFKLVNEQPYSVVMFASSENDSVAYRPKLEIYYKE